MGASFQFAADEMKNDFTKTEALRTDFLNKLSALCQYSINGALQQSYPGIVNVCFPALTSAGFMQLIPEIAVSAGSACGTKGVEPSYVLRAMGLSTQDAATAIRFSFGRFTTKEEMDFTAECLNRLKQPG
jgi:cysteine desulfurase